MRLVGLLHELHDVAGALTDMPELRAALGEDPCTAQRQLEEVDHLVGMVDRHGDAVGAVDRVLLRNAAAGVASALVGFDADQRVRNAARVREEDPGRAQHLRGLGLDAVLAEPGGPPVQRAGGHREVDGLDLVGPAAPHDPGLAKRERRHDAARVTTGVGVVQVIDRRGAVEQDGLLDAPHAEHAGVELVVLLRPADRQGQVVPCTVCICPPPRRRVAARRLLALGFGVGAERVQQLERRDLGRRAGDLAAAEVLQLGVEARVNGDPVSVDVLEHDHRSARARLVARGRVGQTGGARGGQHGQRQLTPVHDGVGTLGLAHRLEMVAVALGERVDGGTE